MTILNEYNYPIDRNNFTGNANYLLWLINNMNLQAIAEHSLDDLDADADDLEEVAKLANRLSNDLRHALTYRNRDN